MMVKFSLFDFLFMVNRLMKPDADLHELTTNHDKKSATN